MAQHKGCIDGICQLHKFEFRVPFAPHHQDLVDQWTRLYMPWDKVRENFPNLFHPQLVPAAGGPVDDTIDSSDESTMIFPSKGMYEVWLRRVLAVSLPFVFRTFGPYATSRNLLDLYESWPIVLQRKSRTSRRAPAAGGQSSSSSHNWRPQPWSGSSWWSGGWWGGSTWGDRWEDDRDWQWKGTYWKKKKRRPKAAAGAAPQAAASEVPADEPAPAATADQPEARVPPKPPAAPLH